MRKFTLLFFLLLLVNFGFSQSFYSTLKATGLTCAMCSYSTQKSLEKLDFIESITPDLEATSFKLEFKKGMFVDFDLIQEKVEDAGFFVGSLDIVFDENLNAENDNHKLINENLFHIFSNRTLKTNVFTLVDKNFVKKSEYNLLSQSTSHSCYKTGIHNDSCCSMHDNLKSNKVFHIKTNL